MSDETDLSDVYNAIQAISGCQYKKETDQERYIRLVEMYAGNLYGRLCDSEGELRNMKYCITQAACLAHEVMNSI